jgi:hypothetical protein
LNMSFLIAMPELVESAATDLAGIGSSLAEAATTAATPTTAIAAAAEDEVSIAVASMFGNFGQQFQALSAQAQAFHHQFVRLINAGAGAYARTEAANAAQGLLGGALDGGTLATVGQGVGGLIAGGHTAVAQLTDSAGLSGALQTGAQAVSNAIANFPIALGTLQTGGAAGLADGLNSFGAAVAAPYQALVSNTFNNLQAIGNTVVSNPFPFLHQLVNNQIFYGQEIATSIAAGIQNLPAELANLPAAIQAGIQGAATFNAGALLQQFFNNKIGHVLTISAGLQNAAQDFVAGVQTLPAGLQAAIQDLLVGDNVKAYGTINQALINAFVPGFNGASLPTHSGALVDLVPRGPLGDVAPILAIPGQMAQSFANLVPAGTIPAQMAQNATNLISAFTNFRTTIEITSTAVTLNFGIPLQLVLDGFGAPANALSALNSTGVGLVGALQVGNTSAAAAALLDAPAVIANAFLNGSMLVPLPPATVTLFGVTLSDKTYYLPLGGILTPLSLPQGSGRLELTDGTAIGGLIPGLLSFGSQLAHDIAIT